MKKLGVIISIICAIITAASVLGIITANQGKVETIEWKDRSRRESWTPEMKEKARQNAYRRNHG